MRVLVTGASGWIGSAVVPELMQAGHSVIGLARNDSSASALDAAGVNVRRGGLDDIAALREAAADADAVIHLAFKHDEAFSGNFGEAVRADRLAIATFGDVLAGSDRPLLIASGTLGVAPGALATEDDGRMAVADQGLAGRQANAQLALSLAERGVRSVVVRLPPTVHGAGDNGFLAVLVAIARAKSVSGYIGDGTSRWPGVNRLDAAALFRLAVENAPAGSVVHAVADEGVQIRAIADVIGRHLHVPAVSVAADDAAEHFGWLAGFLGVDSPASSARTRELLGWEPKRAGLIEDLDEGRYFDVGGEK